jgi:predicted DNA-binding protein
MELTTIYLKPGQKDRLREMAEREDITQAQLIRRGIEMVLREGIR